MRYRLSTVALRSRHASGGKRLHVLGSDATLRPNAVAACSTWSYKLGTGLFAFKHNWGFEPEKLHYRYRLAPEATIPTTTRSIRSTGCSSLPGSACRCLLRILAHHRARVRPVACRIFSSSHTGSPSRPTRVTRSARRTFPSPRSHRIGSPWRVSSMIPGQGISRDFARIAPICAASHSTVACST